MRYFLISLILTMAVSMATAPEASAGDFASSGYPPASCRDRGEAELFLSRMPLAPVEGIWEYPADEVALMVVRNRSLKGIYDVYLVESVDCRLHPGMHLGRLEESPDERKFKISLSSKISKGTPVIDNTGLALLSESGEALTIDMPELKFSFSPALILPALWNRLRLSVRTRLRNPLDRLPDGWIKTYPSTDGNGSDTRRPRYL